MQVKSIIPGLKYRNARQAIAWLCETWGFARHLVVDGPGDSVVHAQLKLGPGAMIMLGTAETEGDYSALIAQPAAIGLRETQAPYLIVSDPDHYYRKAKAAGAKILIEIKDEDYGGRGFTCADPEGHIWNFGSYDPWESTE